jgi:hypothetical protein
MPIDNKYGRVTLENKRSIEDDEPVVVFRAKDMCLPEVLMVYLGLCRQLGSPQVHLELIQDTLHKVERWQAEHGRQLPQSKGLDIRRFTEKG